ncbi:Outer membrane protein TolC [Mariprofundus ferrinatatus]|uniref:Outer membrane protein TolC n=1 Tax=Mariprofundus ferrinatatus TaxID=1921087 RepID=A0A2K8L0Y5_9PROT|nr:TolC family protein [Mariprofundus ferrinatatus]ATX80958.1 Outer membrane protein TolC [Mariprofundus ferrinatatus]
MHTLKIGWLLPALLSLTSVAVSEPLTLQRAETLALQHNPGLQAQGQQAEAMRSVPAQAGALPDPTLTLSALNLPVDSFSTSLESMTQLQVGISQSLPFPGKLGLKQQAAEELAAAAESDTEEFRLQLLRHVRERWWNLVYLDRALGLVRHNQTLLRHLIRVAEAKYKTGGGLQQDVLLAQLELSKLLERELSLQSDHLREQAELNRLLGRASTMPIDLPRVLPESDMGPVDIAALKSWAEEHRPILKGFGRRIAAADAMVSLAEKDYYPDFKLGAAYGFRQGINPANRQSRPDLASLSLSINMPFNSGGKQDRALDQRRAEKERTRLSRQDAVNRVHAEIDIAAAELAMALDQLSLFQHGIIPQARQTTASMLAGYQVNKVDFLNLIRARLNEFNNDIQYWHLYARAGQAKASLAAASGKEFSEGARIFGQTNTEIGSIR